MRPLVLLAATLVAAPAFSQTAFRLIDPVLSVDGQRMATIGAPLVQEPFGVLTLVVPGDGTFRVSDRPFAEARRAGQFEGDALVFAVDGRSVRLWGRDALLSSGSASPAYVTYEPAADRQDRGPARLSVAADPDGRSRHLAAPSPAVRGTPALTDPPLPVAPSASDDALRGEVRQLRADVERLLQERQRLAAELEAALAERDALRLERTAVRAARDPMATDAPTSQDASRDAQPTGARAWLPGFDFARLQNPDTVRRRLDEAEYPRWATSGRIQGDVLVLFQTDRAGRVIRTAVASPLGGGLDGAAEAVVRDMRFVPPVVDGQATGLRSQVVVRFEL